MFKSHSQPGVNMETTLPESMQPHGATYFENRDNLDHLVDERNSILTQLEELEGKQGPENETKQAKLQDSLVKVAREIAEFRSRTGQETIH